MMDEQEENKDCKFCFSRAVLLLVQVLIMVLSLSVLVLEARNIMNFSKMGASSDYWIASAISIVVQILTMCWMVYSMIVIYGDYESLSMLLFIEIGLGALIAVVAAIAINAPTFKEHYRQGYAADLRAKYNQSWEFWGDYGNSSNCCGIQNGALDMPIDLVEGFKLFRPENPKLPIALVKKKYCLNSLFKFKDYQEFVGDYDVTNAAAQFTKRSDKLWKAVADLIRGRQIQDELIKVLIDNIIEMFPIYELTLKPVVMKTSSLLFEFQKNSCGQKLAFDQILARRLFMITAVLWFASHLGVACAFLYGRLMTTMMRPMRSNRFVAGTSNFGPIGSGNSANKAFFNPNMPSNSFSSGRRN